MSYSVKIVWEKTDNFDTMHKKLSSLIGYDVVNPRKESETLRIFSVEEIHESYQEDHLDNFIKFLDEDTEFTAGDGGFNFKKPKKRLIWAYFVKYGSEDKNGCRRTNSYMFIIPRTDGGYKADLEKCGYMWASDHPFIFFNKL